MTRDIALVLPPRERFRPGDAGAAALTVKEFIEVSAYRERITVYGGTVEHFPGFAYQHVAASMSWLLGVTLAYARACARALRQSPARLIEVHNRVELALYLKRQFPERKVSLHFHNDPQGMAGAKTVAERRRLLTSLDAIYCVSEFVRARLLDGNTDLDVAPVQVIYNATRTSAGQPEVAKLPQVVYAGRFIPEKGVLELAQALAQVLPEFPAWKAVFLGAWGFGHEAGRSDYEKRVYAELDRVAGQVDFRGHVAHEEVLRVFAESSISLAPSTGIDAFPRAPIEAMDRGCALIVSAMGGLREIAGDAAIVVDPVTPEGLAKALRTLLQNEARRAEVAQAGQRRAREVFGLGTQIARLDGVRQQLLQEP